MVQNGRTPNTSTHNKAVISHSSNTLNNSLKRNFLSQFEAALILAQLISQVRIIKKGFASTIRRNNEQFFFRLFYENTVKVGLKVQIKDYGGEWLLV